MKEEEEVYYVVNTGFCQGGAPGSHKDNNILSIYFDNLALSLSGIKAR